jgi:hypothetical protein
LDKCLKAFPREEGQVGIIVLIGKSVAGMDLVSRPEVYARLHDKLVRSYVLDALFDKPEEGREGGDACSTAREFLAAAEQAEERVFDSVSYGRDYRYTRPDLAGSALVHEGKLVHAAFLHLEEGEDEKAGDLLASLRHRRRYRSDNE